MSGSSRHFISRRTALRGLLVLPAGAMVIACSSALPTPTPASSPPATALAVKQARPAAAAPPKAAGRVKINFLSWGDPVRAKVRAALTKQFNAAHPNIQADWQVIPGGAGFQAKLLTEIAGKVAPDIFMHSPPDLIRYATEDISMNLSPLIAQDKYDISDYPPKSLQQLQFESKQYAFPQDFPTRGVFYNKGLFDKAGVKEPPGNYTDQSWTWDRFREAATGLTKRSNARVSQFGWSTGFTLRQWDVWIYSNGGEWLNEDLTKCTITDSPCVEALQFLQDLTYKYKVATRPGDLQEQNGLSMFSTGRLGMIEAIPGNIDTVQQEAKNLNWDCTHIPRGKGKYACTGGGSCYAIYTRTPHPAEAWEFFKFSESPQAQIAHVKVGATFPSRYSVYKVYLQVNQGKPPDHLKMFIDAQPFLRLDPQTDNFNQINDAIQKQIDLLTIGKEPASKVAQLIKASVDPLLQAAKYRKQRE